MFQSSDFQFVTLTKVVYLGRDYFFERPRRLTKYDIASVLDVFQPSFGWRFIYHNLSVEQLVSLLKEVLHATSSKI